MSSAGADLKGNQSIFDLLRIGESLLPLAQRQHQNSERRKLSGSLVTLPQMQWPNVTSHRALQ